MSFSHSRPTSGFSLVEYLLVLSIATIVFAGVDTWRANFEVRGKVSDALYVAETAKASIVRVCAANRQHSELTNQEIQHTFPDSNYVEEITVSGTCRGPEILVQTRNTGLDEEPTLLIWGRLTSTRDFWNCYSSAPEINTPIRCRDELLAGSE